MELNSLENAFDINFFFDDFILCSDDLFSGPVLDCDLLVFSVDPPSSLLVKCDLEALSLPPLLLLKQIF